MVPIDPEMFKRAYDRSQNQRICNQYSFTKGQRNIIGNLGEEMFAKVFGDSIGADGINEDFFYRGYSVDVKTKTSYVDLDDRDISNYEGTVLDVDFLQQQNVDIYTFARIFDIDRYGDQEYPERYPKGWIISYMPAKLYLAVAEHLDQGHMDSSNDWKAPKKCYNLPYKQMMDPVLLFGLSNKIQENIQCTNNAIVATELTTTTSINQNLPTA